MSSLQKLLYEVKSPISGEIKVIQDGPERRLVVGGLNQSINAEAPDVEERIWGELVNSKKQKAKSKNALILGLGGGTVAHLLTKKFGPIPIDGVEIDPVIVEVGKEFFGLGRLSNLNIIIANAISVVKKPSDYCLMPIAYCLIIVDLYCGSEYPKEAESNDFFAGLKNLIHPSGVIVFNRISSEHDAEFEEKLKENFGNFQKKTVPSKFGGENIVYRMAISEGRLG